MAITVREKGPVLVLDVEGNIDINASDLIETVGWAIGEKSKDVLCNFENVNLIDYVGISVLAVAYKNVLNHKRRMKLCSVPAHVSKLFAIVGLDRVFETFDNEEVALHSFDEEEAMDHIMQEKLRRRFKRIPLHCDIEYRPKSFEPGSYFKGKILNLSAIGLFMVGNEIFPVDELLNTRLYILPDKKPLDVEMKVVWLADQEIQLLESQGMGLEFYKIDADKEGRIIEFVEKNLSSHDI